VKIIIFGDPHGEIDALDEAINKEKPDYILSTGDLTVYRECAVPHYFIHGNHEDFDLIKSLDDGSKTIRNIHHMKAGETYVLEKGDEKIRIAGLSGNYSPSFRGRERHFTEKDIQACTYLKGIDVFLSHEAPSGLGFIHDGTGEDLGVEPVRKILDKIRPKYFIFGHHHKPWSLAYKGVNVIGMGYGKDGYLRLEVSGSNITDSLVTQSKKEGWRQYAPR